MIFLLGENSSTTPPLLSIEGIVMTISEPLPWRVCFLAIILGMGAELGSVCRCCWGFSWRAEGTVSCRVDVDVNPETVDCGYDCIRSYLSRMRIYCSIADKSARFSGRYSVILAITLSLKSRNSGFR